MKGFAQLPPPFARLGQHEQFDWTALPWRGVYNKVLYFDRISGATLELARVDKGSEFPEHYHTTVQTLFLVSGRLRSRDTVITPGTFNVIPAGQIHGPFFAEEDSIQFKYFSSVPVYILTDGHCYIYREDGTVIKAGQLELDDVLGRSDEHRDNFIRP